MRVSVIVPVRNEAGQIRRTLLGLAAQDFPTAGVPATSGNTVRSIAVALRIATGRPRTGLAARRAVIRSPTARPAPGNKLAGRAAICPATAAQGPA